MKKFIYCVLLSMFAFVCTSCVGYTYATTQDDIYVEADADIVHSNVDFNVVIRYGTPYYYEGTLLYYLYEGLYYYPFYYDNYWYVRCYRRPFAHLHHRPYFRPNRHDYRFSPGHHRGFDRPGHHVGTRPGVGGHHENHGVRPGGDRRPGRGDGMRPGNRRPDQHPQSRPQQHTTPRPQSMHRQGNSQRMGGGANRMPSQHQTHSPAHRGGGRR